MNKSREVRTFRTEVRAAGSYQLVGTGVAYNVLSQVLGDFRERIMPNAFRSSLAGGDDVKFLWDHDSSKPLARQKNGSLELDDTPQGLQFVAKLNPASPEHRSCWEAVRTGLVDTCSFAFTVNPGGDSFDTATDENGKRFTRRTVKSARLYEITATAFPAYGTGTSISARSANYVAPRCILPAAASETEFLRARVHHLGAVVKADYRAGAIFQDDEAANLLQDELNRRASARQADAIAIDRFNETGEVPDGWLEEAL